MVTANLNSAATSTFTVAAGGNDTVTVNGTSGSDSIAVARAATTTVTVNALKRIDMPAANTEALVVAAGLGDDFINVTGTGGPASLTIDGGLPTASDTLTITNTTAGTTTVDTWRNARFRRGRHAGRSGFVCGNGIPDVDRRGVHRRHHRAGNQRR